MRPLEIDGATIHQVAIPFHFGVCGPVQGDSANDLLAISGEPNVTIMETKSLLCNIVPGPLPRGLGGFLRSPTERYRPRSRASPPDRRGSCLPGLTT